MAVAYYHKNDMRGALLWFSRTVETDPTNAVAHANLARLLEANGQHRKAREHQEKARLLFDAEETPITATRTRSGLKDTTKRILSLSF